MARLPGVAVDLMILSVREGRLFIPLIRRAQEPQAGLWALPGRFMGEGESAEDTVSALLEDMLPVAGAYTEQLYTFTDIDRDPRGRVISIAYLVIAPMEGVVRALDRAGAKVFALDTNDGDIRLRDEAGAPPDAPLAFDHARIVTTGLKRLMGKIEYTDIALRFLNDPSAFTLGQLQSVFEAVLGRTLDGGNFRRFARRRYVETGLITSTDRARRQGQGRPAAVYRLTEGEDMK